MAKEIIAITVKAGKVDLIESKTDLLAVGVFSDWKKAGKLCDAIDKRLEGAITKIRKLGDFKAKADTSVLLYGDGRIGAKRILLQ